MSILPLHRHPPRRLEVLECLAALFTGAQTPARSFPSCTWKKGGLQTGKASGLYGYPRWVRRTVIHPDKRSLGFRNRPVPSQQGVGAPRPGCFAAGNGPTCRTAYPLQQIQRTLDSPSPSIEHVGVDHGRLHAPMPEQFLDCPDAVPIHQQVRREGMPQGMAGGRLGDPRLLDRCPERTLDRLLVQVMPACFSRARVPGTVRAGNTYCRPHSLSADRYFVASAYGNSTRPKPSARSLS